jgi:hypothetical protein
VPAAAFAAFRLPVQRSPDAGHLYAATGLAPTEANVRRSDRAPRDGGFGS